MKLIAALAVSVPMLMAQNNPSAPRSVTAIRAWSLAGVTRVAIEVSGDFDFRSDRLHNPERIYFDIPNARPRIESRRIYSKDIDDKLVMRIRAAETAPDVTRVVLDLAGAVEVSTSKLANPTRLVIELRGAAPSVPGVVTPPGTQGAPATAPAPAAPPAPVEAPKAARHTTAGKNSLTRALGLKVARVVIDPGHGGQDQGTQGPKGLLEKDLVLDLAQRVGQLVEDRMGAEVIYTRSDDSFVPLEARTALANEKKADLFLSIHANSSAFPRIAGVETFYLNFTDSKDALDVAARENASSQKSIFELQDIIQKITLHDKLEESKEFAGRIQSSLHAFSAHNFPGQKNRGVKKAPFVVLVGASMPSVLAEIGFLSNAREEANLKKPDYRQKLAEALFRGLTRYADGLSHFQMAQKLGQ
jgi:N-acetylmuramoyl-L-alanine amidase